MSTFDAIEIIEQADEDTDANVWVEAFQALIDSGIVWSLQGFYGREAQFLIDMGLCHVR